MAEESKDERRETVIEDRKEFTDDQIRLAKSRQFKLEMMTYNARALRGDFDSH